MRRAVLSQNSIWLALFMTPPPRRSRAGGPTYVVLVEMLHPLLTVWLMSSPPFSCKGKGQDMKTRHSVQYLILYCVF